jgi:hypothetical protein
VYNNCLGYFYLLHVLTTHTLNFRTHENIHTYYIRRLNIFSKKGDLSPPLAEQKTVTLLELLIQLDRSERRSEHCHFPLIPSVMMPMPMCTPCKIEEISATPGMLVPYLLGIGSFLVSMSKWHLRGQQGSLSPQARVPENFCAEAGYFPDKICKSK